MTVAILHLVEVGGAAGVLEEVQVQDRVRGEEDLHREEGQEAVGVADSPRDQQKPPMVPISCERLLRPELRSQGPEDLVLVT